MTTKNIKLDVEGIIGSARMSMQEQARALLSIAETLDNEFVKAVDVIINSNGRLVVSGMGKSGHIGKKIAASLASTGTRAFFMHPGEAFHGDLGMIAPEDIVLLISNSGESDEVLKLIPSLKHFGNKIIGIHGNPSSTLGKSSDINLIAKVNKETCPHNLAPTTSAMAALSMGDALTVALMQCRGFQPEDFAKYHPGGALGRRLLTTVKDNMNENDFPVVSEESSIQQCLGEMTNYGLGIAFVEGLDGSFRGIVTDGDIRRGLLKGGSLDQPISGCMNIDPVLIDEGSTVAEADQLMQDKCLSFLLVKDSSNRVSGIYIR